MHLYFYRFVLIVSTLLLLPLCAVNGCAQERPSAQEGKRIYVVRRETYDQVLDLLFPRDALIGAFGYAFVLRIQPPFDAESQITILNKAGRIEVIEYRSLDGNIREKLNTIYQRTGQQNVLEMSKQIRVQKYVKNVAPAEVKKLRNSFYDVTCQSANYERKNVGENMQEETVIEDATGYLLWYRGTEKSYYILSGTPLDSPPLPNEHPLVSWMREVNLTLKKFPTTDNIKR